MSSSFPNCPLPEGYSDSSIENRMSSHAVNDDHRCWAQQQGCHNDNGCQDDEENDPNIQDVLGEHSFYGNLADSIHLSPLCNREKTNDYSISSTCLHSQGSEVWATYQPCHLYDCSTKVEEIIQWDKHMLCMQQAQVSNIINALHAFPQ